MVALTYHAPESLEEAVQLLSTARQPVKVLSGGTDLIIQMQGLIQDERLVVDVKKIPGMRAADWTEDHLILGPSMSCAQFTKRQDIQTVFPGLVEAAYLIGSTQVQGRASIGGNLCNASPAADTIPALMVNRAVCLIQGLNGTRRVNVEDFLIGVGKQCLASDELLVGIELPKPTARTMDAYLRFIPRTEMDIAVAGAAVSVTLDDDGVCTDARVAAEALIGTRLDDDALLAAAAASSQAANPISDRRGTVEFRRHVVGVLTKRAAKIAADRVGEV
jgi:CO/xanthine dehydrogenase FAD-binding subunit